MPKPTLLESAHLRGVPAPQLLAALLGLLTLGCWPAPAYADDLAAPAIPATPVAAPPPTLYSYNQITVQRGDTAYSLAREFGLTVPQLLELNGLSTHDLSVGQVLRVARIEPHLVVKGDTLYSLARVNGVTVEALQAANNLSGDTIEIGQWLAIPAASQARPLPALTAQTPAAPTFSVVPAAPAAEQAAENAAGPSWRRNALALLNTPYVYGGNSPKGVDCSSFVVRVFQPLGVQLPRTSAQQARVGKAVARTALQGGDLVFFDTVGRGSVTHVGIYLGDDQFVNANSYYGRVVIDRLESDRYWSPRYLSARRVLDGAVAAVPTLNTPQLALTASLRPQGD